MHVRAIALLGITLVSGCGRAQADATPEGAVKAWLEKMETSAEDPRQMREAYAMLGPEARANLGERAARAGRMQGRRVEPHEMLAEGRFGLRFRPKKLVSHVSGQTALVDVEGGELGAPAQVRCVKEGDAWRIEPDLPEPAPVVRRVE